MNDTELALANLSSCMDGELSPDHADQIVLALKTDDDLRGQWSVYHQIGDALRSADMPHVSRNFSSTFSERLATEPLLFSPSIVQKPESSKPGKALRKFVAVAASIAAVVGVTAVVLPQRAPDAPQVARTQEVPVASNKTSQNDAPEAAVRPVSNEYLMAHRNYSAGLAMHGVVSHVRTVGYDGK